MLWVVDDGKQILKELFISQLDECKYHTCLIIITLSVPTLNTNVTAFLRSDASMNWESGEKLIKSTLSSLPAPETITSVLKTSKEAASLNTKRLLADITAKKRPLGDQLHKLDLPNVKVLSKFIILQIKKKFMFWNRRKLTKCKQLGLIKLFQLKNWFFNDSKYHRITKSTLTSKMDTKRMAFLWAF